MIAKTDIREEMPHRREKESGVVGRDSGSFTVSSFIEY